MRFEINVPFDIPTDEIEYIEKFIEKYLMCINRNQSYNQHLAHQIELLNIINEDFVTKKYKIYQNACLIVPNRTYGITYQLENDDNIRHLCNIIRHTLTMNYIITDYCNDYDFNLCETRKKNIIIHELTQKLKEHEDMRFFLY